MNRLLNFIGLHKHESTMCQTCFEDHPYWLKKHVWKLWLSWYHLGDNKMRMTLYGLFKTKQFKYFLVTNFR